MWNLISLPSDANLTRIRFAVAAETLHRALTSAFMINPCVSMNFSICFQRIVALSIGPSLISSLVLMSSMSDALMAESMNSINTVDSPVPLEVLMDA